ncbi:universal stress protein UspA [Dechloromonas denitrificans]|uniref:Universal stress protein UspA n=1 Tax=Dechloromonas denitrificans TaxID=281362 RepID=A0A133XN57_9RHOO|nr:universal stress protein [Dechloromonas denitrificans]KXB32367.1 universal stress protein UspA [Dechloromonas denitrificans]
MYRHLLVPIDNTDLSTVTVGRAVEFARTLGARITFFHAAADHAASLRGDAEIVRLTSPDDYSYNFEGRARELLTKAESAARACGVPCASSTTVSDSPYEAIIAAARGEGCDLIFMASHGRRTTLGMMLGSQTLKVLINSEIPVLVSAMADPPAPAQAIATIRDEHRSLAAVLHAWLHALAPAADGTLTPDPALMKAMVHYIREFPVALHHPKEEEYLFRKLRERTSAVNPELDELERQHDRDQQMVADLEVAVDEYIAGKKPAEKLEKLVAAYANFMWEHMGREEGVILPEAQRYLTEADWSEINAAFSENRDPRFGGETDAEFKHLFSRIVNLAETDTATKRG